MLIITFFLIGELCHTSGFIDIPMVPQYDIHGMYGGGLMFSLPIFNEDPNSNDDNPVDPLDFTMVFRYGFAERGEVSISMYTPTTYALSVAYLLKEEQGNRPAFFCGIDDISYNTHLSTIGMKPEKGFLEEYNYHTYFGGRPPEIFSVYIAMQKSLHPVFNIVFGLGRGRFIGYGPRSHIFNTDLFVLGEDYKKGNHSGWAFGAFFGGSVKFPFGLELIAEIDGRDGNAGIKYYHKYFTSTLAITKAEHFFGTRPWSPRLTFGVEFSNRFMFETPELGIIECVIRDITSKQLVQDPVIDIREINKRYRAKGGTFSMNLPAGSYTFTIIKPDYEDYIAKISIKPGIKTKLVFNLKKTEEALAIEKALLDKEKNIQTYFSQGRIYYAEGNLNEAKKAFDMVLSLDPSHTEAKDYLAKLGTKSAELIAVYRAEALLRTQGKDLTKAIEYWQKVLDLDAQNTEAKNAISTLQKQIAAAKKPDKPKKDITKKQIESLYKKGVLYFTAEKYDQAFKYFKQVLAHDPNHKGAKIYKKRTEARLKVLQGGG